MRLLCLTLLPKDVGRKASRDQQQCIGHATKLSSLLGHITDVGERGGHCCGCHEGNAHGTPFGFMVKPLVDGA